MLGTRTESDGHNVDDNSVWYDILAFSRPNRALTRLGYPVVRRLQKQFGWDSAASMHRAVPSVENTSLT